MTTESNRPFEYDSDKVPESRMAVILGTTIKSP